MGRDARISAIHSKPLKLSPADSLYSKTNPIHSTLVVPGLQWNYSHLSSLGTAEARQRLLFAVFFLAASQWMRLRLWRLRLESFSQENWTFNRSSLNRILYLLFSAFCPRISVGVSVTLLMALWVSSMALLAGRFGIWKGILIGLHMSLPSLLYVIMYAICGEVFLLL